MKQLPNANTKFVLAARNDIALVSIFNISIVLLNTITNLLIARYLPVGEYGELSYFVNLTGVIRLLGTLGLTSQITFQLASHRREDKAIRAPFYALLSLRIITIGMISGLFVLLSLALDDRRLLIAAALSAITLLYDFLIGTFQGMGQKGHVLATTAAQAVLFFLVSGVALLQERLAERIYFNYVLSYALPTLWALIYLVWRVGPAQRSDLNPRRAGLSLQFMGGVYLLAIAGTTFTSFTTLWLGYQGYFADTALITVPLNLIFMCSAITNLAMTTVYFPAIVDLTARAEHDYAQQMFETFTGIISLFMLMVSISFALFPHAVLGLFYGARYQVSAPLLALLAPMAYCYTVQTVLTFTMVAQGHIRASIPGALAMTLVLCGLVAAIASLAYSLRAIAIAHTLAATLGLVWQLLRLRSPLRSLLRQTAWQVATLVLIIGALRLLIPDRIEHVPEAIAALVLSMAIYTLVVWRRWGARAAAIPTQQES